MKDMHSSPSYFFPKNNVREYLKRTSLTLASIGVDPDFYKLLQKNKIVSSKETLTISDAAWLYIIAHLLLTSYPVKDIPKLKGLLFAKLYRMNDSSQMDDINWKGAPYFIDEILHYIITNHEDILINLYSEGSIEFVCTNTDLTTAKPKNEHIIRTFSFHQILTEIPSLRNVPALKSNQTVISKAEAELLNFLRSSDWTNCKLSKDKIHWQLEATINKTMPKAEATSLVARINKNLEVKIKGIDQLNQVSCSITRKERVLL
ncbi:hypothetical protein ACSX1A_16510 [Pontibacter sp. MBLB2868]|uniref:hypothetical protein n=1 Tax=Pontibacter sp. MBLB2868 TaxID=3451555 RepID=UPI003F7558FE